MFTKVSAEEFLRFRNDYVFKRVFTSQNTIPATFLANCITDFVSTSLIQANAECLVTHMNGKRQFHDAKFIDSLDRYIVIFEMENA